MKLVLALDLATTTGYAVGAKDSLSVSGTWDLKPRRGESPGMRYVRLRKYLNDLLSAFPALRNGLVVYEEPHHRGGSSTEVAVGLATHVQSWCAEHDLSHTSVHTSTLKKSVAGDGRASKEDMEQAARERWGVVPEDDNHADALCVLAYAHAEVLA